MAPAAKKGKKVPAAKKDSPAQKQKEQQQQPPTEEPVVTKEVVELQEIEKTTVLQEPIEELGATADVGKDEAVSAPVKDEEDIAAVKTEGIHVAEAETAPEEGDTVMDRGNGEEEKVAVTEEIAEDMAGEDAEDVEEQDDEGNEVAEHATDDYMVEDAAAMQNGEGNVEAEGSDGEGNEGVAKVSRDDNVIPSGGKIFIGGLSRETTTEMLTRHFEKYGELTDSVIMKNRNTGQPRGFGFVTYADPAIVDRVLQDAHVLDGRTVDAKRTVPRDQMSTQSKGPKTKKVFVGGLTISTTEEDLKTYFEKFGKLAGCQIMQDHKIGKSRGFGFVTFESEQVVEEILAQGKMHEIDGKQVEIKKAEPKRGNEPPPPVQDRSTYFGAGRRSGGFNANSGFYGGFNAAETHYYGGAAGYYGRGGGRPGGLAYGDAYGYGGGYGGPYGYGEMDEGYGAMGYNHAGYGSGSGYGYSYGGGGGYGSSSRGYGSGRYHPYSR